MSSDPLTTLGTADRNRLEALLVEFDLDWAPDRLPEFVERLPVVGGLRAAGLRELVRIDRERHARGGQPVAWEDYLKRYPELLDTSLPLTPPAHASTLHGPLAGGELPEEFGRYRIVRPLGRGGMGRVYLVHDTELDRLVALKVPHFGPSDAAAAERFAREARAAAAIDHPNVCRVYDVGRIDGVQFLTMAYVNGPTLADEMRDAPLAPPRAAEIIRDVARGMAEAHRLGVIHRDLKPANILLSPQSDVPSPQSEGDQLGTGDGGLRTPVVTDFGLARRAADDQRLTTSGTVLGTPLYMSPEQVAGDTERVGPASDVYSLGVVLYELLAGRPPFGMERTEIMAGTLSGNPPPPSSVRREVDPRLDGVVLKAMAKRAAERPSMVQLADALDGWLTVAAPRPSQRPRRRWLVGAAVAVVLLLLLPAGVKLGWFGGPRGPGPEEKKENGTKGEHNGVVKTETTVGERKAEAKAPTDPRALGTGTLADPGDRLIAIGFSHDGKQVFTAAQNKARLLIRRWDAATGTEEASPIKLVLDWAVFSPGGRHVLVGGGMQHTDLLRVSDGQRLARFNTGSQTQAAALSRDGQLALIGLNAYPAGHVVRVYDPRTGLPLKDAAAYAAHGKDFKFVALSDDGQWAYSVSTDREAVWEVKTGKPAFPPGNGEPVRAATFIPGTSWIASANAFGQIAVLDMLKPNEFLHYSNGHEDAVTCLAATPDGKLLLSGGDDQAVRAWHTARNEQKWALTELPGKVVALAVSPDGKRLAAGFANNSWRVWELPAGK